jgi:hypothetical protein
MNFEMVLGILTPLVVLGVFIVISVNKNNDKK